MERKPELIRLEPVDPNGVSSSGTNMYIKNEVLYHVETPTHHAIKKEDSKVYYEAQMTDTKYIPETVHTFQQQQKSITQYPKYQTPKLRAKSSYSPMKQMTTQQHQMYMKQEPHQQEIIIEHINNADMLSSRQQQRDHNTVQVITPNANYGNQQWTTGDVTMTPIMEQTIQTEHGHLAATGTPDAIFIPEGASGSTVEAAEFNTSTINLIPVMTPNGLVFVASNNTISNAVETPQQQQPTPTPQTQRSYNRRKPHAKRVQQQQQSQIVQTPQHVEIITAQNTGGNNLIYTQNGPVLLLNESRGQQQVEFKPIVNTPPVPLIPEKGTVIEEPPKSIVQSRYSNDINENSTQYNTKNGIKSSNAHIVHSDAELDLDAAITVFKIYK